MGQHALKALAANIYLLAWTATLANAQGISEMGAVYGTPKGHPSAGISRAVNRVYGVAGDTVGAAAAMSSAPNHAGAYSTATYQKWSKQAHDLYIQAMAREKAGKINDAQRLYYQVLSIRQEMWGTGDSGALTILLKLGDINVKEKHLDYAETCYKQYLGGLARASGPGSYESVVALSKLAQLYAQKDQYDEVANTLRQMLALKERKFGQDSGECCVTRMNLIDALNKDKEFAEAQELLHTAMATETRKNNQHGQDYLHLLSAYATCLQGLHRDDEARQTEEKVTALKQELGSGSPNAMPANNVKTPQSTSGGERAANVPRVPSTDTHPQVREDTTGKDLQPLDSKVNDSQANANTAIVKDDKSTESSQQEAGRTEQR